jgi:aryl-alcohol dehydrogenase-like predicted oxidoreductase
MHTAQAPILVDIVLAESSMSLFPRRSLGVHSGVEVSALGLGCMGLSPGVYGQVNDADSLRVVRLALDLGVSFLDTAELYGGGHNELLVGRAVAGRRHEVFLATKFGILPAAGSSGYSRLVIDARPETVARSLEGSLRRLGTDYVDLYYQHRIDHTVPVEETIGAMARQVEAGKVRFLGLSEASAATIRRAHAVHPIAAVQSEYSLWSRDIESSGVIATLDELGIALVPYSPLGRGFLSGRVTSQAALDGGDFRRNLPRFQGEHLERNLTLAARVQELARERGCTSAQIALAWVLGRGERIIPIPGTANPQRLAENAAAVAVQLTAEDVARLDGLAAMATGERYRDMTWVNR